MPATMLDRRTALIVIDLQEGIASFPTAHPLAGVVANASRLAAAFRGHGLPVVIVNATGGAPGRAEQPFRSEDLPSDFATLLPELDRQPHDLLISKKTWGAFTNTDLEERLRTNDVTQVVVCGVATSMGVESTARHAHELGFNVTLVADAMTDLTREAHANSLERIFPRLGEIGTTQDIIDLLKAAV